MVLTMVLYCDTNTMFCTEKDINKTLSSFSLSYIQVNNSLWIFRCNDFLDNSYIYIAEHILNNYFDQFLNDDSIFLIQELVDRKYCYELPTEIDDYIQQDPS